MNINKILKISLITLIIIAISIMSFIGVYVRDKNKYSNKIKDYKLAMDLSGYREIKLKLSDEKVEDKSVNEGLMNVDNYSLTKKIIEKRLKALDVDYYEIRMNYDNGDVIVYIPENEDTDEISEEIQYQGKFEIVDNETEEVLMTNDDIYYAKAKYLTSEYTGQTLVAVELKFNKEGKEKLRNITNTYKEEVATEETTEEKNTEEASTKKEIAVKIDDATLLTTSFEEEISNGIFQISIGAAGGTSQKDLEESYGQALYLATLMDNGKIPLTYELEINQYVESEITNVNLAFFKTLCIVLATIGMIYLIIKYKEKGIMSAISVVGYVAVLLIAIRILNVTLTVSGLVAIVLSTVSAYWVIIRLLENENKKDIKELLVKSLFVIIPACTIAIVFVFIKWQPIASFGMVMFWGIIINLLYNFTLTRTLLKD